MNFCMKSTNVESDCVIVDTLKCVNDLNHFQKVDDFQQNCTKLTLPNSVVKISNLSKLSNFSEKKNLGNSIKKQSGNNLNKENQNKNSSKVSKGNIESNTRQAIVNKLFLKNQTSQKQNSNAYNKQNHNQKQKIDLPSDQFYHKHQNVNKLIKLYKEKTQKELKQCTFNPKIKAQLSARNHDIQQFYQYQIEHTKRTQDRIQHMREMIKAQKQKQNTFRPKLSNQTIQLTQRRASANVYDRLYNLNKENKYNEIEDLISARENSGFKRQVSKKSISLVSSIKKKSENCESYEKDKKVNLMRNHDDSMDSKSKELKPENSIKTFQQMFNKKQSKSLNTNKNNQGQTVLYKKWEKPTESKQNSNQNSSKKANIQSHGPQLLDCRQLIKQKRHSNNLLPREQSCKLISSESKDIGVTERKNYGDKQWVRNKDEIILRNKTSQKNQKIALEKFTKQLFTVSIKMGLKSFIDFNQMVSLMKNMNFIQNLDDFYESKIDSELKSKVFQIWTILQGSEGGYIVLMNLFKIFCAIQGYSKASMIEQTVRSIRQSFNLQDFIQAKQQKRLILSQKDSKTIKRDFMSFYLTKFKLGQSKLFSRQITTDQFSFRPSISKESESYAEKYREKIIAESEKLINDGLIGFDVPENGLIDHSTLLILDQKIKNFKMQQKRQQAEKEKRRKQEMSKAHHSSTNRSVNQTTQMEKHRKSTTRGEQELDSNIFSRISHNDNQSRSKDQIFAELYEQGRRSKSNRRDKSSQQIEYESNKEELTFKPKINQTKVVSQFNQEANLHDCIPNYTKQVMRMRRNKNGQKQELSTSPLLYLNVTMQGNSQTKIPVFQTDTLQQITQKVRVMMKIENGQEQKQKLRNILKQQIIPVLDQLGIKQRQGRFFSGR